MTARISLVGIAVTALVLAACGPAAAPPAASPAPVAAATTAPATPAPATTVPQATMMAPPMMAPHEALDKKAAKPKRLEAVIQIDLSEMQFADPQGAKNPTFKLPAGKTVGIHVHNQGTVVHELAIGRKVKTGGGYEQSLTELVPMDLFFYYGAVKAEVEGATFGEIEVDAGVRDTWLRFTVPPELKGEWEIGCFVEGHYEAGMKAKIVFE